MTTVKTLLYVSAAKRRSLHQLDISNAFHNGDLDEEIYMILPLGYTPKEGGTFTSKCYLQTSEITLWSKTGFKTVVLKVQSHSSEIGF